MKIKQGVWTPTAAVICVTCHGPHFKDTVYQGNQWERMQAPMELKPQNMITFCDHCGESIQIEKSIAGEHELMKLIRNLGIYASMWQTGGMNSAVGIEKADYNKEEVRDEVIPHFLITYNFEGDGRYVITDENGSIQLSSPHIILVLIFINKMKAELVKI